MSNEFDFEMPAEPETNRAQITSGKIAKEFCLAGNARVTLVSKRTIVRYTYRISHPRDKETGELNKTRWFVNLLTGQNNDSDYTYIGMISINQFDELGFRLTKGSKMTDDSLPVKAMKFFIHYVRDERIPDNLEAWHEGSCGRCGRALTVPESIERGIGPECAKHNNSI